FFPKNPVWSALARLMGWKQLFVFVVAALKFDLVAARDATTMWAAATWRILLLAERLAGRAELPYPRLKCWKIVVAQLPEVTSIVGNSLLLQQLVSLLVLQLATLLGFLVLIGEESLSNGGFKVLHVPDSPSVWPPPTQPPSSSGTRRPVANLSLLASAPRHGSRCATNAALP